MARFDVAASDRAACFVMKRVVHGIGHVNTISIQNMKPERKTAIVQLRLRPELKKAAEAAARADQRSLTGLIEKLLADHLETPSQQPTRPSAEPRP